MDYSNDDKDTGSIGGDITDCSHNGKVTYYNETEMNEIVTL